MCCSIAWPKSTTCGINISLAPQPQEIPFFLVDMLCSGTGLWARAMLLLSHVWLGLCTGITRSSGWVQTILLTPTPSSAAETPWPMRHSSAQARLFWGQSRYPSISTLYCSSLPYFFNKIASVCCFNIIYLPVLKLTFSYSSLNALHQNSAWLTLMCFSELWEKCGGKSLTKR